MAQEADTQGLVMSHLQMIEHTYDLMITNKKEICGWITNATHNPREVLTVALALNNWVAIHKRTNMAISHNTVEQIVVNTVGRW